jgi:hypothetical protein
MRCVWLLGVVALAGCGGHAARPAARTPASPTPSPTPVARAVAAGPWSAPVERRREPLACPAASSRAGWPSRVLALEDGRFAKLWGRRPRLADVDADGHLLGQTELGARRPATTRALACGRGGRLAAAWVEYRGDSVYALRIATRAPDGRLGAARTVDTARSPYDDYGVDDVALAYAPDGSLLVAYSVYRAVRGAVVSSSGALGRPFKLGPASETSQLAAEIGERGRAVVAWTTIDAGLERNEHRRIYAVTREPGAPAFGRVQLVHRARFLNIEAFTDAPGTAIRLAVAPNGRALLIWGTDRGTEIEAGYSVRVAEAGPHGRFGASRRLAAGGEPGDVAIRSDGTALAVFRGGRRLEAVVHAPGREFAAPEALAGTDPTASPTAAFAPDGRPHVEWLAPGGTYASTRQG